MLPSFMVLALPLLSFLFLFLFGSHVGRAVQAVIGCGGIFLSAAYALVLLYLHTGTPSREVLWTFFPKDVLSSSAFELALYVDSLSLTMAVVVTFVSTLIALYATKYMSDERGFVRFFAAVNLFVAFMLLLVLGDNFWLLFIGWEGVGLCSYLLIGFYYHEKQACAAAMKAFITTRVGDVCLLFGMFICFYLFGTLEIQAITSSALVSFPNGSLMLTIACFCFLGGAVGKSAQLPLQTWLPDAMWGPTPVSALIHAATMVTAGVYLIARLNGLFALSPVAQLTVLIIGLSTLILAGFAALAQSDMKRVLAYSTMSQIGYMFVALGVSAYQAAIFHLGTHAFFKALLFLAAGVIGHAVHTYDLRSMGGLRTKMPAVFWLFVIGAVSLIGVPVVSAGFFSKEWIMGHVLHHHDLGVTAFFLATFGALLTGLYTMRMIAIAFFGDARGHVDQHVHALMMAPLVILALFSVGIGWLETPTIFGGLHGMSTFLSLSLPKPADLSSESPLMLFTPSVAALVGVLISWWLYGVIRVHRKKESAVAIRAFLRSGFAFDWLYTKLLVQLFVFMSFTLKPDCIEAAFNRFAQGVDGLFAGVARLHTGRLPHYVSFVIVSALALASVMVFQ